MKKNWGFFLLNYIYFIFHLISTFKTGFVFGILRSQKGFDVDVFDFHIGLSCRYFGLFMAWRLFGLLFEK
jgi:hypothetical protein